jgi:hypothetical protein
MARQGFPAAPSGPLLGQSRIGPLVATAFADHQAWLDELYPKTSFDGLLDQADQMAHGGIAESSVG